MASNNPTRHSPERNLERGDGNRAEGSLRPGSAGDHHRQEARFRQHFHDSQREASGSSGINTGNTVTDMIVSNLLTQGATFEQCRRYVAVFKGEAVGLQPKTPAEKQGLTEQQLSVENLIDDALQGVPQTRPYQASASQADISSSPQVNAPSSSQQLFPQTDTGSQTNRPHTESTADIVNRYKIGR